MTNNWRKTRELAEKTQTLEAVEASEAGRAQLERAGSLAAAIVAKESEKFQGNKDQAQDAYRSLQMLSLVTLIVGIAVAAGVGYIVHTVYATLKVAAGKLSAGAEMVMAAADRYQARRKPLAGATVGASLERRRRRSAGADDA
jgi:hypothetical protein